MCMHHVMVIYTKCDNNTGPYLAGGGVVRAPIVLSNASVWDTYSKLIPPGRARPLNTFCQFNLST